MKGQVHDMRKAVKRSDLQSHVQLPTQPARQDFLFYQDEGGMRATDEANQDMDAIFYLGVIDICTPYNTAKKLEHFWKSMTEDGVSFANSKLTTANDIMYGSRHVRESILELHVQCNARRRYEAAAGGTFAKGGYGRETCRAVASDLIQDVSCKSIACMYRENAVPLEINLLSS